MNFYYKWIIDIMNQWTINNNFISYEPIILNWSSLFTLQTHLVMDLPISIKDLYDVSLVMAILWGKAGDFS